MYVRSDVDLPGSWQEISTGSSAKDDLRGNYLDMSIIQTAVQRTEETLDNEPPVEPTTSATDIETATETTTETTGLVQRYLIRFLYCVLIRHFAYIFSRVVFKDLIAGGIQLRARVRPGYSNTVKATFNTHPRELLGGLSGEEARGVAQQMRC